MLHQGLVVLAIVCLAGCSDTTACEAFLPGTYTVVSQQELGPDAACYGLIATVRIDPSYALNGCMGEIDQRGCQVNARIDCVLGHGSHTLMTTDLFIEGDGTYSGTIDYTIGDSPDFANPSCHTSYDVVLADTPTP